MPVKVRCPTCDKVLNAPETARGRAVTCPGCDTKVKIPAGDAPKAGDSAKPGEGAKGGNGKETAGPLKIRCPTCDKVLSPPESARGKSIKCPGCDSKVKVPAGDSAKAPARKKTETDSIDFLANLDLDKVIDSEQQICPRCGAQIPEDAAECPKCGVDPSTGVVSASARKRMSRKGADPALFYGAAWSDSWAFMLENKRVAFRTGMYITLVWVFIVLLILLATWLNALPPAVFLGIFALAAVLAIPGWYWHLTIETIKATVSRKSNIRSVHFDVFQNVALGVKTIVWAIVFCTWLPFVGFMYPLAMIHFAMPVTTKAWIMPSMIPVFFKNLAPTLYYWVVLIATSIVGGLVSGVGFAIAFAVFGSDLTQRMAGRTPPSGTRDWIMVGVLVTLYIINFFVSGFVWLFHMRVIGLLALYFKDTLDLNVHVAEKTYVHKEVKLDVWGNPIKSQQQKVLEGLLVVGVLLLLAGVGYFVYWYLNKPPG